MNVLGTLVAAGLAYIAYSVYRTNKALIEVLDERKRHLLEGLWAQIQQNGDTDSEIAKTVQSLLQEQQGK
jgi:hypothetical protein